jgi:hypothetical protein
MKTEMLALVFALGVMGEVEADFYRAGNIASDCESSVPALQDHCHGYIAAVVDTTKTWTVWLEMDSPICIPGAVTPGQLKEIFLKRTKDHPEKLHLRASDVVLRAVAEAFPCK